jgi:hypothetical protein
LKLIQLTNYYYLTIILIMNTNQPTNIIINAEYFRNRFIKHDAAIKELTKELMDLTVKKISSRKKRDYQEAFLKTN